MSANPVPVKPVPADPMPAANRADHWDAATDLFADNLRRFERGEPLRNVVDKAAGY